MDTRRTRTTVAFARPFCLAGYEDELPAGHNDVVVDEDPLQGLSVEA